MALVDPALPRDTIPSLACPNCKGRLIGPAGASARRRYDIAARPAPADERATPRPRAAAPRPPATDEPLPSHAAVGLALAALFLLVLMAAFVWLMLTPHQHYWWGLTK